MPRQKINSLQMEEHEFKDSENYNEDLVKMNDYTHHSNEKKALCTSEYFAESLKKEQSTCEVADAHHSCKCSRGILEERTSLWIRKNIFILVTSAILLPLGLYFNYFTSQALLSNLLFLAVIAISGYELIESGVKALLKGHFNMNLLMTIAVTVSFLIGSGAEGTIIIFLFYIAELLEDYAGNRARKSIKNLLELAPNTAIIKKNGKTFKLDVKDVKIGDILVVKPGDKIPLDGKVTSGISTVNQAAITGESIPVTKTGGDKVFAATINEEGYMEIEVTKKSDETVLSRIIKLVKESQLKKSSTETFIERFAKYYTPAVILIAATVAIIPPLLFGQTWDTWIYRGLVLLVISCPCAFLLSTPVAMVSGITAGTRHGVLIKGSKYLEEMKNIDVLIFDKTGTITEGKLEVTDIQPLNSYSKCDIIQIAGSLESKSKHPLAEAIIKHLKGWDLDLKPVKKFESITGEGVKGRINRGMYHLGKKSLFEGKFQLPEDIIKKLESEGKTVVLLGNDTHIMGLIAFMDKIRSCSTSTIQSIKKKHIKTVMLTGDNEETAKAVSSRIGVDEYYSGLLPEDKVTMIEEFLHEGGYVAMVGDGVNDAPALARANVGIAMAAAGSDVAIETADIALMEDNISKVNYILDLSRNTMRVVKQNVLSAILIQVALAVFAVFGFVPLWMAVTFGDVGLTILVILNALRIGNKNSVFAEDRSTDLLLDDIKLNDSN